MAGKGGGGSWKVAYTDFVTAMMAFFLVMWIGAQDAKTRQSVANYFIDPIGASNKPGKRGDTLPDSPKGPVMDQLSTNTARGNDVPTQGEPGHATALLMKWLNTDEKQKRRWRDEAEAVHDKATRSPEVIDGKVSLRDMKVRELKMRLQSEFTGKSPTKSSDIYQDLMMHAIQEVNWEEIAGELIGK